MRKQKQTHNAQLCHPNMKLAPSGLPPATTRSISLERLAQVARLALHREGQWSHQGDIHG